MDHRAFLLHAPRHPHQPPADDGAAECFIDLRPDDHVAHAGFILQRDEDHARGRAGPLARDDQPADLHPPPGAAQIGMGGQAGDGRSQQFHRMGAQRQAQGEVILDHLLAQRHAGQVRHGFLHAFAFGAEQRQGFGPAQGPHLPQRIAPVQAKAGKAVSLGQPFQRRRRNARAAPDAFDVGVAIGAGRHDPVRILGPQPLDLPHPQPQRQPPVPAPFQRAIPGGMRHGHGPHLHPMFARIAHDLGGGVKAHGLAVQQRTGKGRRMVAFQPGRGIDQQRETGGMGFGKAVFAEPLDLGKAAVGEVGVIPARQHPFDEAVAKGADGAHALEGGERPAQPIRLLRGEACPHHGNLHRLFLEQRHPQRAFQHRAQVGGGQVHRLLPLAAVDVGMHHAALDGAGADDGDLDHQIIEFPRPHPRQEIHLRPAFHLEHPHRIGAAQHVIGGGVFLRQAFQRVARPCVPRDQIEALADAGQHPEAQHIHLQDAQRVDIVLVPFDHRAPVHRGILDRAQFVQPPAGDDKAADMLRQVARKADDLGDQAQGEPEPGIAGIQPDFGQPHRVGRAGRPAPALPRQRRHDVIAEAHDLAHLADRGAGAEMDDGGNQPGAVAAIAVVDPLDHLLAPLVFEIDVDVGRLAAGLGHEAFEHHGNGVGRHLGDAERIADDRIGRRAAPLAQDAARAGEIHDVVDGQEIGREPQRAHDAQLLGDLVRGILRHSAGKAAVQALRRQPFQPRLRGFVPRHFVRVFVAELLQRKPAAPGDVERAADGGRMVPEQPRHVGGRLQPAFGIRQRMAPDAVDGQAKAQACQHIGELAAVAMMHQHVAQGDHRQPRLLAKRQDGGKARPVAPVIARCGADETGPGIAARHGTHHGRVRGGAVSAASGGGIFGKMMQRVRGEGDQDQALASVQQVGAGQLAPALVRAPLAQRQQARQAGVSRAVGGQRQPFGGAIGQHQPRAGDQPGQWAGRHRQGRMRAEILAARRVQPRLRPDRQAAFGLCPRQFLQRGMGAHDTGQRIAVGDGDGRQPQFGRPRHQFLGVRGPGQEGEVRGDAKFRIGGRGHPARPSSSCPKYPRRRQQAVQPVQGRGWRAPVMLPRREQPRCRWRVSGTPRAADLRRWSPASSRAGRPPRPDHPATIPGRCVRGLGPWPRSGAFPASESAVPARGQRPAVLAGTA